MKKIALLILILLSTFLTYAQKRDTVATTSNNSGLKGNNELKLNLIMSIAGVPELNYERIISDDMSVGVAVWVGIGKQMDFKFGIIPNYRVYFGRKRANGFFIEGNMAIIGSDYYLMKDYSYVSMPGGYYPEPTSNKTQTNFGLGAAAGAKFLSESGFVGEIFLGVGRLFGENSIKAYPRIGITIGKRF